MKVERLAIWAESGTGDDFKCVHLSDARELESLLREALSSLKIAANTSEGDSLCKKIEHFLST